MSDLYAELSVPKNASDDDIKAAYRREAQKRHPDRPGGDAERFHALQVAYDVLSNHGKRAQYDEDGEVDSDTDANIAGEVAAMIVTVVDHLNSIDGDVLAVVRNGLAQQRRDHETEIAKIEARIAKREKALSRLKLKAPGPNHVASIIGAALNEMKRSIEGKRRQIARADRHLALLAKYEYEVVRQPVRFSFTTSTCT